MSDVLERFMRYVQVDSQSDPENEERTPSTDRQHDMARLLADELRALGCEDAAADEHAYVTAHLPASPGCEGLPALGLCAHIDSSPDAPGAGVKPHVVRYEGGALVAGVVDGVSIETSPSQVAELERFKGQDIVCSDGTTLLSADDKAGVAEIMSLVARLVENPALPHPRLAIAFVPDEEIGHGASLLDIEAFGAEWAYTVDGGDIGELSYECFSAAQATVRAHGVMVHPGSAKDVMVNAITVLREFDSMLPAHERPEHTEGRDGFNHLMSISGDASDAQMTYILRDFDAAKFAAREQSFVSIAALLNERHGEGTVEVELREQYRNMAEKLEGSTFLVDNALEAFRACEVEPFIEPIRGGTDGAQLTFRGLPCPNLSTGGFNFHSVREFIPVSSLETMVDVLEQLVARFAKEQ